MKWISFCFAIIVWCSAFPENASRCGQPKAATKPEQRLPPWRPNTDSLELNMGVLTEYVPNSDAQALIHGVVQRGVILNLPTAAPEDARLYANQSSALLNDYRKQRGVLLRELLYYQTRTYRRFPEVVICYGLITRLGATPAEAVPALGPYLLVKDKTTWIVKGNTLRVENVKLSQRFWQHFFFPTGKIPEKYMKNENGEASFKAFDAGLSAAEKYLREEYRTARKSGDGFDEYWGFKPKPLALVAFLFESLPVQAMQIMLRIHAEDERIKSEKAAAAAKSVIDFLKKHKKGAAKLDKGVVPHFEKLANSKTWWCRLFAADLMTHRPEFRNARLQQALRKDENVLVRRAAARSLDAGKKSSGQTARPVP